VAADYMGHESVPPRHWKYLAVSTLIAAIVGKGVSYVRTAFVERSPPTGMLK